MIEFNKGDIVVISPDSCFYDQAPGVLGKIVTSCGDGHAWVAVEFENGYSNSYRIRPVYSDRDSEANVDLLPALYNTKVNYKITQTRKVKGEGKSNGK